MSNCNVLCTNAYAHITAKMVYIDVKRLYQTAKKATFSIILWILTKKSSKNFADSKKSSTFAIANQK